MRAEDRPQAAESGRMLMFKQKYYTKKFRKEMKPEFAKMRKKLDKDFGKAAREIIQLIPDHLLPPTPQETVRYGRIE